jgi:hypothetical protein
VRPCVRHLLVLVVAGIALVGSGLSLALGAPRAAAPDIGPPPATATATQLVESEPERPFRSPSSSAPADPGPPAVAAPAPAAISLPATPEPVLLVPVGVLESGALQLPERPSVLGWYAAGAVPGDPTGTAVVAGHIDSAEFGAGPLEGLLELQLGASIVVTDAAGGSHPYSVMSRTSYPKAALPADVFRVDGPPQLALVTCGGAFDERTGHYAENVVVLAAPAPVGAD